MRFLKIIPLLLVAIANSHCSEDSQMTQTQQPQTTTYKYLALGDSYTIGESVCQKCRYPEQLKDSLMHHIPNSNVNIDMVATTGWTTNNLIQSLAARNLPNDYNLVTLLIGVNNQFQHQPFSVYESEFPQLINSAIMKAGGDKSKVIVISIPDYAYTPYGQGTGNADEISQELSDYNTFALHYCQTNNITFVYITDITQQGLNETELVASDGLHPSVKAYTEFVQRILPKALLALQ